jgi:TolB-like protein/cytochrome c-type biogenesis protein CcmH/NrfG
LVQPKIAERKGRIVKVMGDGLLAEFSSIVEAVQCAIDIQQDVAKREPGVSDGSTIRLRIGVNLGDIIVEGSDIYGDGVNVAARLETLADPGGICISGPAFDTVEGKLDLDFEDLGEQRVKNIARPLRVYRLAIGGPQGAPPLRPQKSRPLSNKPSIAVLPFANMSGEPEQEYFADGIAEDIITALAKFHSFLVIARNSSFTYKGRAIDVREVARDLSVRYVVEGSVRRALKRVRVTAQLIDVESGSHVWAERYDRELDDIFLVQDEITQSIAAAIGPEFESAEIKRASRVGRQDLTVWDLVMQARWHLGQYNKNGCAEAQELLLRAADLDDRNAQTYGLLAMTYWMQTIYRWSDSITQSSERALEAAQRAVSLDDNDANAQATLGMALSLHQQHGQAIEVLSHAVRLNPNLAAAHGWLGIAHTFACDFEHGVQSAKEAIRLSPRDLDKPFWMAAFSFAALAAQRYEEVIEITTTMLRDKPDLPTALRHRAPALAWLGRIDEARQVIDKLLQVAPDTTVSQVRSVFSLGDRAVEEHWLQGLRMAGLSE